MSDYQINLERHGVLLATLEVSQARYVETTALLRERFPLADGFGLRIRRRRELRRILEQGPEGLRLLGIEYRHEEVPDHA
ncbi:MULTISPECIES: hypothetical protein [unclassified Pseudomonas]|uniref:hypothetical protein n=1 Tax=unclassified Pseudomonas TaxID=196821 RepID=UPI000DA72981|nr:MULTISPECIES: hypothetical protein [unclassified Pseudomonas]MDW3711032.1 hypothetical protein [Pseudomonas sp. 2023EL-01195]PZE15011.1 hypothetical protein DMX10_02095 [Pseudomonas sp. 57B-090624]